MPVVNPADVAAVYNRIAKTPSSGADTPRIEPKGPDFGAVLRDAAGDAIEQMRKGEEQTLKAAAGTADMNQVVMAVAKADMTLQTVVAVRDRVIQAYQDVLRMPI